MATILRGFKRKKGNFVNDAKQLIDYDNLTLYFTDDSDMDTIGETSGMISAGAEEFQLIGAEKLQDLIGRPIMMVIDPSSIGVGSDGKPKKPKLQALLACKAQGTPSSPAAGDANSMTKTK